MDGNWRKLPDESYGDYEQWLHGEQDILRTVNDVSFMVMES